MPRPRTRVEWDDLAVRALDTFLAQRGAVIWPEVEAFLGELPWIQQNLDDSISNNYNPSPIHLHAARQRLSHIILEQRAVLQGQTITALIDRRYLERRQKTQINRLAAEKRRLYRSWLAWTGNVQLCGHVAERIVLASMRDEHGQSLWVPPSIRPGTVARLAGKKVPGGPLDAAGFWIVDPDDLSRNVPFAVEVKNIRSTIYPYHAEVWDLLAKMASFPEIVPVLIARRIHPITFKFFKDIGALGRNTSRQWFAATHAVDPQRFDEVTRAFGFADAERIADPSAPNRRVAQWFKGLGMIASEQREKWRRAAPLAANAARLRDDRLTYPERQRVWTKFHSAVKREGLYVTGGWAL